MHHHWIQILILARLIGVLVAPTILSEYHQNDFDVKLERLVVPWYNRTVLKDVKADYVPYNRTHRMVNASTTLLMDFAYDVTVAMQCYKFLSNEYRFFPITLTENICDHFSRNSFNAAALLKNVSNIHPCPWKKGFYYAYRAAPDFSRFPPLMPRGSYKLDMKIYYKDIYSLNVQSFHTVIDKPIKWKN